MELSYFLNAMTFEKKNLDFSNADISRHYNIWSINKIISMVDCFVPLANVLNKYEMTKQSHYNLLKDLLPKQKIYFNYINKKKDLTLKEKKYIAKYFEVGMKEAELYVNILPEEILHEIFNVYKYGINKMVDI